MIYYIRINTKDEYNQVMNMYEGRGFSWNSGRNLRERKFGDSIFDSVLLIKEDLKKFGTVFEEQYAISKGAVPLILKNTNKNKYIGG